MHTKRHTWLAFLLMLLVLTGCAELSKITGSTWHHRFHWEAEDYFDDPQVIALCKAIEANDLDEIDRLVAAGADVNAQGKGRMTPLLWSFFDNELKRFTLLLELGADPNITFESDFGTQSAVLPGESVTHMATSTTFPGYFDAVFKHRGDPNLVKTAAVGMGDPPLFTLIKSGANNKKSKIQILLDLGANVNHLNASGTTATRLAVGWGGQYDIALMLLEAGADHRIYKPNENSRLVHAVLAEERRRATWTPPQEADYQALLKWLVDHGESLDEAKADRERWKSWSATTGEYRRKMDAEIAQRKAREAREKRAAEAADPAQ